MPAGNNNHFYLSIEDVPDPFDRETLSIIWDYIRHVTKGQRQYQSNHKVFVVRHGGYKVVFMNKVGSGPIFICGAKGEDKKIKIIPIMGKVGDIW